VAYYKSKSSSMAFSLLHYKVLDEAFNPSLMLRQKRCSVKQWNTDFCRV